MTDGPRRSFCHNADGTPKWSFFDKKEAKRIARAVASRPQYQVEGRAMHLYLCPTCKSYHLGHDVDGGHAA